MGRESASHLDTVKDAIGRSELPEASRVRSVRAVDPEGRPVAAEHSVEKERLYGCDTELVVDIDECDARSYVR